jgi:hypothetical protein
MPIKTVYAGFAIVIGAVVWFVGTDSHSLNGTAERGSQGSDKELSISKILPTSKHESPQVPQSLDKSSVVEVDVIRGQEKDVLIENLPRWASTYDKMALQKISQFVFSADSDIRSAAIDAVVAVGIPEGADVLEEAMRRMTIPEEIVEVKEKVKFLRLPSSSK